MFDVREKPKMVERALLVGAYIGPAGREEAEGLIEELGDLVTTLGVPIVGEQLIHVREPQSRFLLGTGKAEELHQRIKELKADVVVFDNELTPAQQRNWEKLTNVCVIDRQEVIIDIFASRAQTREARLQVELARLEYSLPRLTRAWTHLSRQGGGIGGRGEGESQLEIDKRLVRGQIDRLKRDLEMVRKRRATQRKDRKRTPVPNAAIVGYTNAGKSSLLTRLTGADVLVEDKLFATLDTTTRRVDLPNNQPLLLTDTVGFVRKLPHRLVEAFHATLEESVEAEFLIHLLDASSPDVYRFHSTTLKVLEELGAANKKTLTVFNKIDKVVDRVDLRALKTHFPDPIFISVHTGEGLEDLRNAMADLAGAGLRRLELVLPHDRADVVAMLHREGNILATNYDDPERVRLVVEANAKIEKQVAEYIEEWSDSDSAHDIPELIAVRNARR